MDMEANKGEPLGFSSDASFRVYFICQNEWIVTNNARDSFHTATRGLNRFSGNSDLSLSTVFRFGAAAIQNREPLSIQHFYVAKR